MHTMDAFPNCQSLGSDFEFTECEYQVVNNTLGEPAVMEELQIGIWLVEIWFHGG